MDVHLKTHTHRGAVLHACNLSRRVSVTSRSPCSTHRVPCQPGLHSRPCPPNTETEQQHALPFIRPHHNGILRNPGSRCHLLCGTGWSVERHFFPGSYGSIWPLRLLQGSDCSNICEKLVVCLDTYLSAYLLPVYIFFFWWVRVLMCTTVWPWTCYAAKVEPSWFSYLSFLGVAITGVCGCAACMWVYRHTCSCTHLQRPDKTSVSSTMTFSFIALRQGLLLIR